ncbi:MAG: tetratricopeptide repeat protein, partial [Phycisphaerae bacterium]
MSTQNATHFDTTAPRVTRGIVKRWLAQAVLAAGLISAISLLTGCPPTASQSETKIQLRQLTEPAPRVGMAPTAGELYQPLPEMDLTPKGQGATLAHARTSFEDILRLVEQKGGGGAVTMPAPTPKAPNQATPPTHEPPPMAVKYYLRGRELFLQRAYSESIQNLDQALRLDPQAFDVLRLMGRVCFASNQIARGSLYLERAWALHPDDVEVNYLLGRYWLERKQPITAIYHLARAQRSPETSLSAPVTPINTFYLARALQSAGYSLAAAQQYEAVLDLITQPFAGYHFDPDVAGLIQERALVHLAAADNFARVDELKAAIAHDRAALELSPGNAFITARLVGALVRLNQADEANRQALQLALDQKGSDDSIALLTWAYRQTGRQDRLLADVQSQTGTDGIGRLALARLQQKLGHQSEALTTLLQYQKEHPEKLDLLPTLVDLARPQHQMAPAFTALVRALHAQGDQTTVIITELYRLIAAEDGPKPTPALLALLAQASIPEPELAASRHLLLGLVARAVDQDDLAEHYLEAAVAADPRYWPARQSYVKLLLAREQCPRANQMIRAALDSHQHGAKAWTLYIESEIVQNRYASALKIATQASDDYPDNIDLRLLRSAILDVRDQDNDALLELKAIVTRFPDQVTGYYRLLKAAIARSDQELALDTLGKLLRQFPQDRGGRILAAQMMIREHSLPQAQSLLETLIREQPDDPEALGRLATILVLSDKADAGLKLLTDAMQKNPANVSLVQDLVEIYGFLKRPDDAVATARRAAQEHPDSESLAEFYATTLLRHQRTNDADAWFKECLARFDHDDFFLLAYSQFLDQHQRTGEAITRLEQKLAQRTTAEGAGKGAGGGATVDLHYRLANLYYRVDTPDNFEKCVAQMRAVLAIMPDHVGANNDLGYFLAEHGVQIDQAATLVARALENQPNHGAFIDSMGWVRYQQGKYDEAVKLLSQAIDLPDGNEPECITHLADALWRAGKHDDAVVRWRQAAALAEDLPPERVKIKPYLQRVLAQVQAKQNPSVSASAAD